MILLEGANCNLHSYVREESKKDLLYDLWKCMEMDGDSDKLLWAYDKSDLVQFILCFADPNVLFFTVYNKNYSEYVGFVWLHEIKPGFKCHTGIYIRKKYRKQLTDEAGKLILDFAFDKLNLKEIWGHTPWENVRKSGERSGFKEVAVLPNHIIIKGVPHNYYISVLKKE